MDKRKWNLRLQTAKVPSMPYGYVYIVRNKKNGKCYVGQTTQPPERRFDQHRRRLTTSHCKALSAAIRRHGADAFEFAVIAAAEDKSALDAAETAAISAHDLLAPRGYNIKTGGSFGKHSAQTKQRMSLAHKGKPKSSAQIEKFRLRMLGTSPSAETRAKIAAALRGRTPSTANAAALRAANLGRVPSEESRHKMSANRSGIPVSEATKKKLRVANLGKRHSAATRARMTAAQIARWAVQKASAEAVP